MSPDATPPESRVDPPLVANERSMLEAWLDFHRETLPWKCEGLSDEQLKQAAVPPSNLTLLGLVRHMAEVERGWFAELCGLDETGPYSTEDDPEADFDNVATADVSADFETFAREVATYREHVARLPLDAVKSGRHGREFSLRWIYLHMIEEYARHNGHADLIREAIDGTTGD
ncbi:MAG: DinB family protein [Nocardioidaceae bacterium]